MTSPAADANSPPPSEPAPSVDELEELRSLLLGPDLTYRLEKGQPSASEISQVLPEAIVLSQQEQLTTAVVPTIEEAITTSVHTNEQVLSDALFPIIGPATRKAVAAALKNLTKALDQGLEHSLSIQSIKWRIEAWRTGRSFAEILLLRTLLYQVEQVFLIHKQDGLVLQHLVSETAIAQDPDLVSAMLTALQDFVKDSFQVNHSVPLNTLEVGDRDLTIWVEDGPQALIACIIRGNAPNDLRVTMQDTLEKIHLMFSHNLTHFRGDNTIFEPSQPYLKECLQAQFEPRAEALSPLTLALLEIVLLVIMILVFWGLFSWQQWQRWSQYVEVLKQEPGIVILETHKQQGKFSLLGLRDLEAIDPKTLIKGTGIRRDLIADPQQWEWKPQRSKDCQTVCGQWHLKTNPDQWQWEPYWSFHPRLIQARVKRILAPPEQVSLNVDSSNRLIATGSAPIAWIRKAEQLTPTIPGITALNTKGLAISEEQELDQLKREVEETLLFFATGQAQPSPGQEAKINGLNLAVSKIINLATLLSGRAAILIEGHTDDIGDESANQSLSQARADWVFSLLVDKGIDPSHLKAIGLGTQRPLRPNLKSQQTTNRRVSFKITTTDIN